MTLNLIARRLPAVSNWSSSFPNWAPPSPQLKPSTLGQGLEPETLNSRRALGLSWWSAPHSSIISMMLRGWLFGDEVLNGGNQGLGGVGVIGATMPSHRNLDQGKLLLVHIKAKLYCFTRMSRSCPWDDRLLIAKIRSPSPGREITNKATKPLVKFPCGNCYELIEGQW